MMNIRRGKRTSSARFRCPAGGAALVLATLLGAGVAAAADAAAPRTWGFGWDEGLTVRRVLVDVWELSVAAGPDDNLLKIEERAWDPYTPSVWDGVLEVPLDTREEHGWVRAQVGRRVAARGPLALTAFTGLTYNWIDGQERALVLDDLVGDYDSYERDRFTERWILAAGLRPAWRATDFLTIEFAFGLRFVWESWDETVVEQDAGTADPIRHERSSHGRAFEDFGWEGLASLQFFFWP
ncbi:hypothetical protein KDM41_16505 [bacterium]|nr:hypothetical protein [bacterium]